LATDHSVDDHGTDRVLWEPELIELSQARFAGIVALSLALGAVATTTAASYGWASTIILVLLATAVSGAVSLHLQHRPARSARPVRPARPVSPTRRAGSHVAVYHRPKELPDAS
jgi:hypothetical protein